MKYCNEAPSVTIQSVIQSYLKTPVCGASLSSCTYSLSCPPEKRNPWLISLVTSRWPSDWFSSADSSSSKCLVQIIKHNNCARGWNPVMSITHIRIFTVLQINILLLGMTVSNRLIT